MPERQLNNSDHDLLIRLDTKLDSLAGQFQSQNTLFVKELAEHEHRLQVIEGVHERLQPEVVAEDVKDLIGWKAKFDARWKLVVAVCASGGTIIGTALGIVLVKFVGKS